LIDYKLKTLEYVETSREIILLIDFAMNGHSAYTRRQKRHKMIDSITHYKKLSKV
jgi:hypothetical protein